MPNFGSFESNDPQELELLPPLLAKVLSQYVKLDEMSFATPDLSDLEDWKTLRNSSMGERAAAAGVCIDLMVSLKNRNQARFECLEKILVQFFQAKVDIPESKLRSLLASIDSLTLTDGKKFYSVLQKYMTERSLTQAQADFVILMDKPTRMSVVSDEMAVRDASRTTRNKGRERLTSPSAKRREKTDSFSATVIACAKMNFPNWTHVGTVKSSGPIVIFEVSNESEYPRLQERVYFQKGMYGANWFRLETSLVYKGTKSGDIPHIYECSPGRPNSMPDQEFTAMTDVPDWVTVNSAEIASFLEQSFLEVRTHYPGIDRLMSSIREEYASWYTKKTGDLRSFEAYSRSVESSAATYAEFEEDCLTDFRTYLRQKGLLEDNECFLRGFWCVRPRRKEDFATGDYNECACCEEFKKRGVFVHCSDSIFGEYVEFICSKCHRS